MPTVRLAMTSQLEDTFALLDRVYKPMSRSEILKMGLADLYRKALLSLHQQNQEFLHPDQLLKLSQDVFDLDDPREDIYSPQDVRPFRQ